jgi:hypothetical protein
MRLALAIVAALSLGALAAGCGATTHTVVRTVTVQAKLTAQSPDQRFYGHVVSLVRAGRDYELRFDPEWFLSGVTANVAQAEDAGTHCRPAACPPVANDNYTIDEGHRVLTFIVPDRVRGTVLVKGSAAGSPFPATTISVRGLAQIVAGTSRLKLFEPLSSGVWLVVRIDRVVSFAQQYRP